MKEFVKNIAVASCCLLVVCCTNAPNQSLSDNYYIEENDSIPSIALEDLEEVSILNYSDLYDSVSLVKLEAHPEALIGRVSKVEILENGNFLVFDNANAGIFVFSQDGRFLNTVGCQGNGAKEYITPEDVVYDAYNDEVIVWDHNKKNLMFFHPDGRFVRKVNIPWYIGTLQVLDKDHIAVFMNHRDEIEGEYGHNIKVLDREGIPVSEGLPYDKRLETFNPACKKAFSISCGVLFCNPPYSPIVYEIGQDSIMPRYFLDFGDRAIPKNWFGSMDHRELNKQLRRNPNLAYCASFHETANFFLLNIIQHGTISICLFPKSDPQVPKSAAVLWNDMYGLVSGSCIATVKDDKVVTVFYADQFEPYQEILEKESDANAIKKEIANKLYGQSLLTLFKDNKLTDKIRGHILSSRLQITPEERAFVMDVKSSDNPILQIGVLK